MKLVRLVENAANSFGYTCPACHKFCDSKNGGYADLEGPPFHTFYCKNCGDAKTKTEMQRVPESPPTTGHTYGH
jgi:hypothetical protein